LTKDISFKWTSHCENAFKTLKQTLITAPVLGYPNFNKPFILACDASGSAIGYILSQLGDDNKEHVIGYNSFDKYRKQLFGNRTRITGIGFGNLLFSYLFSKFYF